MFSGVFVISPLTLTVKKEGKISFDVNGLRMWSYTIFLLIYENLYSDSSWKKYSDFEYIGMEIEFTIFPCARQIVYRTTS